MAVVGVLVFHKHILLGLYVNPFPYNPWFLRVCSTILLKTLWGKGEFARNEQFLLFPQCFLSILRTFCHFHQIRICRLQTLLIWKSPKFVVREMVNGLVLLKMCEKEFSIESLQNQTNPEETKF